MCVFVSIVGSEYCCCCAAKELYTTLEACHHSNCRPLALDGCVRGHFFLKSLCQVPGTGKGNQPSQFDTQNMPFTQISTITRTHDLDQID